MQNAKFKMQTVHAHHSGVNAATTFTQCSRSAQGLHFAFCILNYLPL